MFLVFFSMFGGFVSLFFCFVFWCLFGCLFECLVSGIFWSFFFWAALGPENAEDHPLGWFWKKRPPTALVVAGFVLMRIMLLFLD